MTRRWFISLVAGAFLLPSLAFGAGENATQDLSEGLSPGGTVTYTPEIHEFVKKSNQPYILEFYATWCGTCRAQDRAIKRLRAQNADYDTITILRVNWDAYRNEPVARDLNIPRRSTLVLLTGEQEIDRVIASTRMRDLQDLFDQGLRFRE